MLRFCNVIVIVLRRDFVSLHFFPVALNRNKR
jgi:hypothetical protein